METWVVPSASVSPKQVVPSGQVPVAQFGAQKNTLVVPVSVPS
jgi:hypothetical protein